VQIYGGTYTTANITQTVCDANNQNVAIPKLISTFCVNTSTCIMKDRAFATLFGNSGGKPPTPLYHHSLAKPLPPAITFLPLASRLLLPTIQLFMAWHT
jgi:hypothetical protein